MVAPDFSRFVKITVHFGGAIRDMILKRVCACLSVDTSATF
jgi:hypothetical protein